MERSAPAKPNETNSQIKNGQSGDGKTALLFFSVCSVISVCSVVSLHFSITQL